MLFVAQNNCLFQLPKLLPRQCHLVTQRTTLDWMKLAGSPVDVVDIYNELFVYVDCKNIPQICDIKLKFEKKSIKSPLTLDPVTIDR